MAKSTKPDEQVDSAVKDVTGMAGESLNPAKQEKPVKKYGGFCVYLGPSIHGVILNGAVFNANKKATLADMGDILEKYPLVADLIIPGDALPECRLKVQAPGNLLYVNYQKLAGQLKTK